MIENTKRRSCWYLWLALGLAALGCVYYYSVHLFGITSAPAATVARVSLPDGIPLTLKRESFAYNLVRFLASPVEVTASASFVLDRINFEFGSLELTMESAQKIDEIATILKSYPSVEVRVDGYTDNLGDPAESKRRSLARAQAIKEMLVRSGIEPSRVATEGHGQDGPVASNDTQDGRATNRRLELVVLKK
jgi:OmpA-OmpF porin, OOP family